MGKSLVSCFFFETQCIYILFVCLCVCVDVIWCFVYRGRSTHPGSVVHLSDNPVDVNRVSLLLILILLIAERAAKYCDQRVPVSLSVSPLTYLRNHVPKLHTKFSVLFAVAYD